MSTASREAGAVVDIRYAPCHGGMLDWNTVLDEGTANWFAEISKLRKPVKITDSIPCTSVRHAEELMRIWESKNTTEAEKAEKIRQRGLNPTIHRIEVGRKMYNGTVSSLVGGASPDFVAQYADIAVRRILRDVVYQDQLDRSGDIVGKAVGGIGALALVSSLGAKRINFGNAQFNELRGLGVAVGIGALVLGKVAFGALVREPRESLRTIAAANEELNRPGLAFVHPSR